MTNVIDHLTDPERFGSQAALAEAAGCEQPNICAHKKTNGGRLRLEQMRLILKAAKRLGIKMTPLDFFPNWDRLPDDDPTGR